MKQFRRLVVPVLLIAAIVAGCSDNDRFTLTLTVKGLGQQSVTMTYYADGSVNQTVAQPDKDNLIHFTGRAAEPALVELSLTAGDRPLAMLVARNGEKIKCELDLDNPASVTVKGCKASEQLAAFVRDNADLIARGDRMALNARIKDFVVANPGSVASTALLVAWFDLDGDAALADSLMNTLSRDSRPYNLIENFNSVMAFRAQNAYKNNVTSFTLVGAKDSLYTLTPRKSAYTLLAFTGADHTRRDTLTGVLRDLARDYPSRRLKIVEVSMLADSTQWRAETRRDSARWDRTWVPGSAAAIAIQRLQVTRTPFFIVADSLGAQLYRSRSVSNARRFIQSLYPEED